MQRLGCEGHWFTRRIGEGRPLCSTGGCCTREPVEEAVVVANVALVFPDPVSGYSPVYARDSFPVLHGIDGMLFLNLG